MTDADKAFIEQTAIKYARWLAERDGITIEKSCDAVALWGNHERVQSVTFTTKYAVINISIPHWDWEPGKEAA